MVDTIMRLWSLLGQPSTMEVSLQYTEVIMSRQNSQELAVVRSRLPRAVAAAVVMLACALCVTLAGADSGAERAGDIAQVVIPAAAGLSALAWGDLEGTGQFCKSLVGALGITYALKYTVDRDRPEGHGAHSFPSGHTAAAFQGAAFIERRHGWYYGLPCYLGAAFVGWSRIEAEADKHDAIDVFGGAAVGALMSYCFTTRYKGAAFVPTVEQGRYGVCISARW